MPGAYFILFIDEFPLPINVEFIFDSHFGYPFTVAMVCVDNGILSACHLLLRLIPQHDVVNDMQDPCPRIVCRKLNVVRFANNVDRVCLVLC